MIKNKFKMIFLKKKISIFIIAILLIIIGIIFTKNQDLKYSLIEYKSIPHIELTNILYDSSDDKLLYGYIHGFVVFDDKNNQPKNLSQYYIIKPLPKIDENLNQIFSLEEIIVLDSLPPKNLEKIELIEKNESYNIITLEDDTGNQFFINKLSKEITMKDVSGESVRLITNNLEYRDFIWGFLKN